jgi:hypothetical protein
MARDFLARVQRLEDERIEAASGGCDCGNRHAYVMEFDPDTDEPLPVQHYAPCPVHGIYLQQTCIEVPRTCADSEEWESRDAMLPARRSRPRRGDEE